MGDDEGNDSQIDDTEKRKLAFSEIVLLVLAFIGVLTVIWLGWFAK